MKKTGIVQAILFTIMTSALLCASGWDHLAGAVQQREQVAASLANHASDSTNDRSTKKIPVQHSYDSTFSINKPVPSHVKRVFIQIAKDKRYESAAYEISSGLPQRKLYLHFGEGEYKVWVQVPSATGYTYYDFFKVVNHDTRPAEVMECLLPAGDIQSDNPEIIALARKITDGYSGDMAKTSAIHDWVARNIVYDMDAYFNNQLQDYHWDALEVLHRRLGICTGYANLTAALNRAVGIKASVVRGMVIYKDKGETWDNSPGWEHAWNQIQVDGRWINVDTCWDAGYTDYTTQTFIPQPHRTYFDISPDYLTGDHRLK